MSTLEKPLTDTRVLEFGHIVAGPFCSLLLADLGAEVIKIERPGTGEIFRRGSESSNSTFNCMNRSKKSLTVNLKATAGKELIR
jgi:crotonobetainyl-CoA:carnitine CoA-transferase CaiB-like acyl-CoA transferase